MTDNNDLADALALARRVQLAEEAPAMLAALRNIAREIEAWADDECPEGAKSPNELAARIVVPTRAILARLDGTPTAQPARLRHTHTIESGARPMFDFEWTGKAYGDEADRKRGIAAALNYCADRGIDPAKAWAECLEDDGSGSAWDVWTAIEMRATHALCEGWQTMPENVSLIWQ